MILAKEEDELDKSWTWNQLSYQQNVPKFPFMLDWKNKTLALQSHDSSQLLYMATLNFWLTPV